MSQTNSVIFGTKSFLAKSHVIDACEHRPFESESDVTYGQVRWPILWIRALHLTHPKCTHTHTHSSEHTHTVNTHTAVNTHTMNTHTHTHTAVNTHYEHTHTMNTHTQQWTHTLWTHTRSSGQPFMLRRPGNSWGSCLKGLTSIVVLKVERVQYIQLSTIRPQLPHNFSCLSC